MIEVTHLSKRFGHVQAVADLSFRVARGEIVGFLGPNGAGKTTTMRILTCFLTATGGQVTIAGLDVLRHSMEVRRRIGYLPENVPLYADMRVCEYLTYRGRLKGLSGRKLRTRLSDVLESCGLADVRGRVIDRLSKGYKKRVGLADSLIHEPEVLILDEPTIGLDPNQVRHIRGLIKGLAERHTVLLSSHILPEVESVCHRVLIINKGRIVASDTPDALVGLMRGNRRVVAEVQGPGQDVETRAAAVAGVVRVSCETEGEWTRVTCEAESQADIRGGLFQMAVENRWPMRELREEKKHLEDVFIEMTTPAEAVESAAAVAQGAETASKPEGGTDAGGTR